MQTRTKAILGLSTIFLTGLLCGGLGVGLIVREQVRDRDRLKDPDGFREYFSEQLSLSEKQRDSLASELERAYDEINDIRAGVEVEYQEVFDTLTNHINPILNSEQRQLLQRERKRLLPKR